MNGWFLAAGSLLGAAFFIHLIPGNRFYSCVRPERGKAASNAGEGSPRKGGKAYEAWLMGRCGVQMITVDLALQAVFLLLLGFGVIPRNRSLELFLLATFPAGASSLSCRLRGSVPRGPFTCAFAIGSSF